MKIKIQRKPDTVYEGSPSCFKGKERRVHLNFKKLNLNKTYVEFPVTYPIDQVKNCFFSINQYTYFT